MSILKSGKLSTDDVLAYLQRNPNVIILAIAQGTKISFAFPYGNPERLSGSISHEQATVLADILKAKLDKKDVNINAFVASSNLASLRHAVEHAVYAEENARKLSVITVTESTIRLIHKALMDTGVEDPSVGNAAAFLKDNLPVQVWKDVSAQVARRVGYDTGKFNSLVQVVADATVYRFGNPEVGITANAFRTHLPHVVDAVRNAGVGVVPVP
jgi:hypothetical protein